MRQNGTAMTMPPPAATCRVSVMDIGGSHITAAKIDITPDSAVVVVEHRATLDPHASAEVLIGTIVDTANSLDEHGVAEAWTIAIPGPFDYEGGSGSFEGVEKFAALAGVSLRDSLAPGLSVPPAEVRFLNDADSYGLGEWKAGAAVGHDRVICITLGTGVGSCFLENGTPLSAGEGVPRNGEAHLLQYDGRPLEDSVSTRAIARAYSLASGATAPEVRRIAENARAGDADALAAIETAMVALGQSLAPWVTAFRAGCVVVGGAMAGSWDLLEGPFRRGLGESARGIVVVKSALMDDAPLVGAAAWATR
jgi:glucokinase